MAYSTQTDLLKRISEDELIQLTDKSDADAINTAAVTQAIADADAEIDSYCGRYTLPFAPVPVMVKKISVDIAIYNLYGLTPTLKIPEDIQKRYENAAKFLLNVSKGLISLGADAPDEATDGGAETTRTKADRIFTTRKVSDGSSGSLDNY